MIGRRDAVRLLALLTLGDAACAPRAAGTAAPSPPTDPPLHLDPLSDLLAPAGLVWVLQARPTELFAHPTFARAAAMLAPATQFDTFARRHGGVDVRQATELIVAEYAAASLALARLTVVPAQVEAAFTERARAVDGRAIEPNARTITRLWGTVGDEREQIATFGHDAIGLERGRLGPLRAAIYFAERRLKRSLPALRAEPLASIGARLGDAPLRWLAPGPFDGPWTAGLGGLLRAATAAAVTLTPLPVSPTQTAPDAADVHVALTGAWGDDAPAAADRLGASFAVLAVDPLGRLTGMDRPLKGPEIRGDAACLHLDVTIDLVRLAEGLRAATSAGIAEILNL